MAENNAKTATPKGKAPAQSAENTPRHKLLAMGQKVATEGKSGKTSA